MKNIFPFLFCVSIIFFPSCSNSSKLDWITGAWSNDNGMHKILINPKTNKGLIYLTSIGHASCKVNFKTNKIEIRIQMKDGAYMEPPMIYQIDQDNKIIRTSDGSRMKKIPSDSF